MGVGPPPVDGEERSWAEHAASGATPHSLAAIAAADPTKLNGADLVDAIVATEKALSLLSGLQMRMTVALAEPFVAGDPMRLATRTARKNSISRDDSPDRIELCVLEAATCLAAAEIAAALRISPVTAGIRVREATTMTSTLAPTLNALEQGLLDRGKARVITEHCQPLSPENIADLQSVILPEASRLTTGELRELTGQAVIAIDPEGAQERHLAAAARRELSLRAQPDAMATLSAFLPADGAVKIFQISDLLGTSTAGVLDDTRGIGARRIDALIDIADHLLTHGHLDLTHYLDHPLPDAMQPPAPAPGRPASDRAPTPSSPGPASGNADSTYCGTNSDTGAPAGAKFCKAAQHEGAGHPSDSTGAGTDPSGGVVETPTDPAGSADPEGAEGREGPVNVDGSAGFDGFADPDAPLDLDHPAVSHGLAGAYEPEDAGDPHRPTSVDGSPVLERPASNDGSSMLKSPASPAHLVERSRRALTRQGRRPHLSVAIGLDTLAGRNQLPALLAGFGAIPACLGRAIALSAGTVTALFTDPRTGHTTDAGELTYRPTQQLRDKVAALYATYQFPSCRQPVWRCDIDHRDPFNHRNPENGGHTEPENMGPFCRRHHLLKHHSEWRFRPNPDDLALSWTSPTGHQYSKTSRPTLLPHLTVTTGGSALAERLDLITAMDPRRGSRPSSTEELLTTLLLHHRHSPMEYDPVAAWDQQTDDHHAIPGESVEGKVDPDARARDGDDPGIGFEDDLPDEPPF